MLGARYYAPEQGRFVTRDPFPGVLTEPASLTPYTYALNNPVMYTDPSGEFADALIDIVSIGYDVYTIINKVNRGCAVLWSDWAALGMDALSLAIPFVPAVGGLVFRAAAHGDEFVKLAKVVDKSGEAIRLANKMENVRETGRIGESLAGIVKNTKHIDSFTGKARFRIPDVLNRTDKLLQEVKNVKKLAYTNQLKDYVLYAQEFGYRFELIVRESTAFTSALQDVIDKGYIIIKRSLP